MKTTKLYKKSVSHTIQPQKFKKGLINNQIAQGYLIINTKKEEVPSKLMTNKNELFRSILLQWHKDNIQHSYEKWDELEKDINRMIRIKAEMEVGLAEAHKKVDDFHTNQQADPIWIEQLNRIILLIEFIEKNWNVVPLQYENLLQILSYLIHFPTNRVPTPDLKYPSALIETQPFLTNIEGWEKLRETKSMLFAKERSTRFNAIGRLRGTDDDKYIQEGQIKGAIFAPFIMDSRRAIANLVSVLGNTVAIFSLERGGSLLADHLHRVRQELLNVKIPKSQLHKREEQHLRLIFRMMDAEEGLLFKMLSRNPAIARTPPPLITFAITETAISGSSVNTLLKTLKNYSMLLPYTKFKLLVEKQTMKDEDFSPTLPSRLKVSDLKIRFAPILYKGNPLEGNIAQIEMFIAQTQYIIGEDVGYQVSYDTKLRGAPLVIFDEIANNLVAVSLQSCTMLPREMIIELIAGAYDDILKEKGLL